MFSYSVEKKMMSHMNNFELKSQLFSSIESLGKERSLFPFSETPIDEIILRIEKFNPTVRPLSSENFSFLLGEWLLLYASNGIVVTRGVNSITDSLKKIIHIKKIWQTLSMNKNGNIVAYNNALIDFPILGESKLNVEGVWQPDLNECNAQVSFQAFSIQTTQLFGQLGWSLPEVKIPILDFLRKEALWITSYLDEDMRIGRGVTGNLFVFRRCS